MTIDTTMAISEYIRRKVKNPCKGSLLRYMLAGLLMIVMATVSPDVIASEIVQGKKGKTSQSGTKKSITGNSEKKTVKASEKSGKKKGKKGIKGNAKRKASAKSSKQETSAEVKRREEATLLEIRKTREEIEKNEREVSKGVSNLQRLKSDMEISQKELDHISGEVTVLGRNISGLETKISSEEKKLERLRDDYRKAVKKMRVATKRKTSLAFIFSSRSFSEAMRRLRYLKDFSEWKDKQTAEITAIVNSLKNERTRLANAKIDRDAALERQTAARNRLKQQHDRQDAIVVELRRNGDALQSHLAKKQAEANQLKNQVASLIAQEEARRQEALRKQEEARLARERAESEARAREAERLAAEAAQKAEEQEAKLESEREQVLAQRDKRSSKDKQEVQNNQGKKSTSEKQKQKDEKSYAQARKRKPRSEDSKTIAKSGTSSESSKSKSKTVASTSAKTSVKTASKASSKSSSKSVIKESAYSFENMRGTLPRPVSGVFKVVSPFGRQSLPDLPDVTYDNPGIDAEVSKGATAQAVYDGEVSAIYVVPGYSTVVIVSHGNYYTVYGNLASTSVKSGDKVKQGQGLGKVAVDSDEPSHSVLHFEVWKKREKLNPMSWIR